MAHDEATRMEVTAMLTAGMSYREIEASTGIGRATVYRWMQDEDFRRVVTAAQANFREIAISRLRGLASRALAALDDALEDGHADRTRVALEVLDRVGMPRGVSHDVTVRQAPVDREALAEWVASKLEGDDG